MGYKHAIESTVVNNTTVQVDNDYDNDVDSDMNEPMDGTMCLGVPMLNKVNNTIELLIGHRITVNEFMNKPNIGWCEIMQIKYAYPEDTPHTVYYAVIKTFWLRVFQRIWKQRYYNKQ